MLRKLFYKKGQNTAEYALLIALAIAGVVAMQTYVQRSLQGRVRDAGVFLTEHTSNIGNAVQYAPYYENSAYDVTRDTSENKVLGKGIAGVKSTADSQRNGEQRSEYNTLEKVETDHTTSKPMPSGI